MPFFIIFVVVPLLEILVFMAVGEHIGIFTTLLLALLTAIIGGFLVRKQGLQTFIMFQAALRSNKIPHQQIFDGFCLIAAGAMLITPGFVTDTAGFLLLVPQFRLMLRGFVKKHTHWQTDIYASPADSNTIEGEYTRLDDDNPQLTNKKEPENE